MPASRPSSRPTCRRRARSASQVEAGITRSVGVISPVRRSSTMPYRPPYPSSAVEQRQRRQHPGHREPGGMLGDHRGPVPGPVPRRAVLPADPPQRGQGQRLPADPGQAEPAGQQDRRREVQQRGSVRGGRDDQDEQGAEHGGGARGAEPEHPDAAAAAPPAVIPGRVRVVVAHWSPPGVPGGCMASVALRRALAAPAASPATAMPAGPAAALAAAADPAPALGPAAAQPAAGPREPRARRQRAGCLAGLRRRTTTLRTGRNRRGRAGR